MVRKCTFCKEEIRETKSMIKTTILGDKYLFLFCNNDCKKEFLGDLLEAYVRKVTLRGEG